MDGTEEPAEGLGRSESIEGLGGDAPVDPLQMSGAELSASESESDGVTDRPRDLDPEPASDAASGVPAEQPAAAAAGISQPAAESAGEDVSMDWYILKVQSNRENSIADALERRVAVAGLGEYFGEIVVPTEKVTEFKGGKKRIVRRKLYPGYILVRMHINDDTWFLVRETPGIGDFTGAGGRPTPMLPHEVQRIITKQQEKTDEAPKLKISFSAGDRVKINEGTFENFEGEVSALDEASGRVTVMINIFGRSTPVELEYWQVESV
jgi:transcriptional antiterminator NusG